MKARDHRQFLKELRRATKSSGLDMTIINKSGSHQGVVICDPRTGKDVKFVIPNQKDVSPGVQRSVLKYLSEIASHIDVADIVYKIIKIILGLDD